MNFSLDLNVKKRIGTFDTELVEDFFKAVTDNGKFNLHLEKIHGRNSHHIVEAAFKSFARALKMAAARDGARTCLRPREIFKTLRLHPEVTIRITIKPR